MADKAPPLEHQGPPEIKTDAPNLVTFPTSAEGIKEIKTTLQPSDPNAEKALTEMGAPSAAHLLPNSDGKGVTGRPQTDGPTPAHPLHSPTEVPLTPQRGGALSTDPGSAGGTDQKPSLVGEPNPTRTEIPTTPQSIDMVPPASAADIQAKPSSARTDKPNHKPTEVPSTPQGGALSTDPGLAGGTDEKPSLAGKSTPTRTEVPTTPQGGDGPNHSVPEQPTIAPNSEKVDQRTGGDNGGTTSSNLETPRTAYQMRFPVAASRGDSADKLTPITAPTDFSVHLDDGSDKGNGREAQYHRTPDGQLSGGLLSLVPADSPDLKPDPSGKPKLFSEDPNKRKLTVVTHPNGSREAYSYGPDGNTVRVIDTYWPDGKMQSHETFGPDGKPDGKPEIFPRPLNLN